MIGIFFVEIKFIHSLEPMFFEVETITEIIIYQTFYCCISTNLWWDKCNTLTNFCLGSFALLVLRSCSATMRWVTIFIQLVLILTTMNSVPSTFVFIAKNLWQSSSHTYFFNSSNLVGILLFSWKMIMKLWSSMQASIKQMLCFRLNLRGFQKFPNANQFPQMQTWDIFLKRNEKRRSYPQPIHDKHYHMVSKKRFYSICWFTNEVKSHICMPHPFLH